MRWLLLSTLFLGIKVWGMTLSEAEAIALSNNPQVKASEELLEKAKQGRLESISKWLPQLSLLSQAFKIQKPIPLLGLNKPTAFFTQLSLTQSLISSEILYGIKIAGFSVKQAAQMLDAARNDVLYAVRTLYYLVILDQKKVDTAKEHMRLLTNLAQKVMGLHIIGEATAYQVNQAKVAIANVTDHYYQTLKELKNHHDELIRVLGYDPQTEKAIELGSEIDYVAIPTLAEKVDVGQTIFQEVEGYSPIFQEQFTTLEEKLLQALFSEHEMGKWTALADETRPDVLLSKTIVSIARERIAAHRGEYWPNLSLLANYGGAPTPYLLQPSTQFNSQFFEWGVGVSLGWNLFDGTGRERRIKKAKAEHRSVIFEATKVLQAAHTDVRDQIHSMEKALSKFLTAAANVKLAEETVTQATSQLDIGYVTIFDYLISVDGLIRAKTSLEEGKFELVRSYYGLLHACGRKEI